MTDWRQDYVRGKITKQQLGLEVGPSHNPLVTKSDGYNVKILDHTNRDGLVEKYSALNIDTSKIEEVDYVWSGKESMFEMIGKKQSFDYIVASHVIEHTTDVLGFLSDCQNLLKPKGKLILAVPDKRYCFDHFRGVTTIADAIDAYDQKRLSHTRGRTWDFLLNSVSMGGQSAWGVNDGGEFKLNYALDYCKKLINDSNMKGEYLDIHNWLFTPESLELLIYDLRSIGLIKLEVSEQMPTSGFEFFATLTPQKSELKWNGDQRVEILKQLHPALTGCGRLDELEKENAELKFQLDAVTNSRPVKYARKARKAINKLRA
jgi:SAM-dependent methyltransferase